MLGLVTVLVLLLLVPLLVPVPVLLCWCRCRGAGAGGAGACAGAGGSGSGAGGGVGGGGGGSWPFQPLLDRSPDLTACCLKAPCGNCLADVSPRENPQDVDCRSKEQSNPNNFLHVESFKRATVLTAQTSISISPASREAGHPQTTAPCKLGAGFVVSSRERFAQTVCREMSNIFRLGL